MNYARLSHVRAELNAENSTASDPAILRALDRASTAARTMAHWRQLHSTIETRYFSGDGQRRYLLGRDLLSVTTLKISNTVYQPTAFENTLVVNTDYTLWPRNAAGEDKPYRAIVLNPTGQFSVTPPGIDNIQIVGKWGYSEIKEAVVGAAAVTATIADTTGLTITTSESTTALLDAGDTVFIEDEELGPIISVASGNFLVQARGINGTTAAAHATKALSLRRYPADIERAVAADAARFLWRAAQGYSESAFTEQWGAIRDTLASYADPAGII